MPLQKINFTIPTHQKVTLFLAKKLHLHHKYVQRLFDINRVFINEEVVNDKKLTHSGEITVELFVPQSKGCKPIFTTKDFMVFDKPAKTYIHPQVTYKGYTFLDEIRHFGGNEANPGHRLDRETSGLVLCGKSHITTKKIKSLFEQRLVNKEYEAVVHGKVTKAFTIDEPLSRTYEFDRSKHKVKVSHTGKASITLVKPISYDLENNTTFVKLTPITGRTHQLRVHMFHVKHPIVGDPLYGASYDFANRYLNGEADDVQREKELGSKRLMLHSSMLEFSLQNRFKILRCSTWNI